MRVLLATMMLALVPSGPVSAETLVAIRPGVMCTGADALAMLTRPDGSSRAANAGARPRDMAARQAGGCIDIPSGARVDVQQARRNTSIVTYDAHDGRGPGTFFVPNIDFAAGATAAIPVTAAPAAGRVPGWPDRDYKPLVSAFRLLDTVRHRCPQQNWNEHSLSHTEVGPWDCVENELTPAQQQAIEKETEAQCRMGLSCPADIELGMEVQMEHEAELVRLICSAKPAPDL